MSQPDPNRKLRWMVPVLALIVIGQAGFFVYVLFSKDKLPPAWPMLAGDILFSLLVLFVLWRTLGRRGKD